MEIQTSLDQSMTLMVFKFLNRNEDKENVEKLYFELTKGIRTHQKDIFIFFSIWWGNWYFKIKLFQSFFWLEAIIHL